MMCGQRNESCAATSSSVLALRLSVTAANAAAELLISIPQLSYEQWPFFSLASLPN